ncbi:hypothetical protein RJT34_16182 [Clitoria ternatea]|uniref:Uncharacterized protein n=1 Tax=Clitoria ternatea TaxID=43366 RepID=A0AAN9J9R5_CLITE
MKRNKSNPFSSNIKQWPWRYELAIRDDSDAEVFLKNPKVTMDEIEDGHKWWIQQDVIEGNEQMRFGFHI